MKPVLVVLDTNVLVSALRSRLGASYRVLSRVGTGVFDIALSVPLVLEYEEALGHAGDATGLAGEDVRDVIDYMCSVGRPVKVFFLWRPFLRDVEDDHVLEVAVAGRCDAIVTFNTRNFRGSEAFAIELLTPRQLLERIGERA